MLITLCARAKILELLEPGKSFRIKAIGSESAGSHIDLVSDSAPMPFDSTISVQPPVLADMSTVLLMIDKIIDYDYVNAEFVISKRGS